MVFVNGKIVEQNKFPDGTLNIRINDVKDGNYIRWLYDNDGECWTVWLIAKHMRSCGVKDIVLFLPYVPNARMDRVNNSDEIFTLKWFAEFINQLNFTRVYVLDPHSNVTQALINNVTVSNCCSEYIMPLISGLENTYGDNILLCYPDEGACKRYSEGIEKEYVFGIKHRDWRTGKIKKLEIVGAEKASGKNVLIVDDICSKGGTFNLAADALKKSGAGKVFVYVTHCENTIFEGPLIDSSDVDHIFTTDSIYRGKSDKITVL